jgi:hypothetical protein
MSMCSVEIRLNAWQGLLVALSWQHCLAGTGLCQSQWTAIAAVLAGLMQNALVSEATLMRKFSHPAVLPLHTSFVSGKELWFVTPYMVRTRTACC